MEGPNDSDLHQRATGSIPSFQFSRASTHEFEPNQNESYRGLAPFGHPYTCRGPPVPSVAETGLSGSESGQSDFATIITVDDLGFGASWRHQVQKYSFPDYSSPAQISPQTTSEDEPETPERQVLIDAVTLSSVGGQFPRASQVIHGSTQELKDSFDEALKDEIRRDTVTPDKCYDELWHAMVLSKHNSASQEFVPQDRLFTTIDDFNVRCLLQHAFPDDDDRQLNDKLAEICSKDHDKSRRMILATLVLMNEVAYIEDFIREDIRDIHLPLAPYHDNHRYVKENAFHKKNDRADTPPLTSFRRWRRGTLRQFFDNQYRVLAPFFDIGGDRVCFYKLDSSIRLPFLEYSREQDGGHGSVWKAKIHPAHHNFAGKEPETDPYFAIKAIYSEDYERYRDEVRVLERWSGSTTGHDHLIGLLMAFQHGTKYYLLFPWATGNLVNLWESRPLPPKSLYGIRWIMAQCLGMADGLKKIHHHRSWPQVSGSDSLGGDTLDGKNLGRHGDIKPENILWFDSDDRLVIADFGLTRFHSSNTVAEPTTPDRLRGVSLTYRPPEADLDAALLQRYDVWSLGCLYLEFITWYLVGHEMTRGESPGSFNQERIQDDRKGEHHIPEDKFFNLYPASSSQSVQFHADVKESVKNWITKLRDLKECSQCISEFLDLIETDMLVPDPHSRYEMRQVCRRLSAIEKQCSTNEDYCISRVRKLSSKRFSHAQPAIGKLRHSLVIHDHAKHNQDSNNSESDEGDLDNFLQKQFEDLTREKSLESELEPEPLMSRTNTSNMVEIQQGDCNLPATPISLTETQISPTGHCPSDRRRVQSGEVVPRLYSQDTATTGYDSLMSVKDTSSSLITTPPFTPEHSHEEQKPSEDDQDSVFLANESTSNSPSEDRLADKTNRNRMPTTPTKSNGSCLLLSTQNYPPHGESPDHEPNSASPMSQAARSSVTATSITNGSVCNYEVHIGRPGLVEKDFRATNEEGQPESVHESQEGFRKSCKRRVKAKCLCVSKRLRSVFAKS